MAPKFWEVFCEDGKSGSSEQRPKEYKNQFGAKKLYLENILKVK